MDEIEDGALVELAEDYLNEFVYLEVAAFDYGFDVVVVAAAAAAVDVAAVVVVAVAVVVFELLCHLVLLLECILFLDKVFLYNSQKHLNNLNLVKHFSYVIISKNYSSVGFGSSLKYWSSIAACDVILLIGSIISSLVSLRQKNEV